jgi:hypothetical protein
MGQWERMCKNRKNKEQKQTDPVIAVRAKAKSIIHIQNRHSICQIAFGAWANTNVHSPLGHFIHQRSCSLSTMNGSEQFEILKLNYYGTLSFSNLNLIM